MTALDRLQALLPPPLSDARDSVLGQLLEAVALQIDAFNEDLDRMRRTHWVNFAYRLEDLYKLAALLGIDRFVWEDLHLFRSRLLAMVAARLRGAVGPEELKQFVLDYLRGVEGTIDDTVLVPGLARTPDAEAYGPIERRPLYRPLQFVEWPARRRHSNALRARSGRLPYLHRWTEFNGGLEESMPRFVLSGFPDDSTAVPMLVNLSSGEFIGYAGVLRFGQRLVIEAADDARTGRALLAGEDVSDRLFSIAGFTPGVAFELADLDAPARLPRMRRGENRWIFLLIGRYDLPSLNRSFFAMADEGLFEGRFDETNFNQAVFPSGTNARLAMSWIEAEPASFEIRIPRHFVIESPAMTGPSGEPPHALVARALAIMIARLRAAGVRAGVRHLPFRETQRQRDSLRLPWIRLETEIASAGREVRLEQGGRFGETELGGSRFE